jgi:integrator complex subunit 11
LLFGKHFLSHFATNLCEVLVSLQSTKFLFSWVAVSEFDRSQMNAVGPCVLFATPGMLSGGLSLEVFKQWAPSEKNMVVVPG